MSHRYTVVNASDQVPVHGYENQPSGFRAIEQTPTGICSGVGHDAVVTCATTGSQSSVYVAFSFTDQGDGIAYKQPADSSDARPWKAHRKGVTSCHQSDGILVTGSRDLAVKCWSTQSLENVATIPDSHELSVSAVACDEDLPGHVASGSRDTSVAVWEITPDSSVTKIASGSSPRNLVTCMRFLHGECSPLLVQGSEDLAVRLWDWKRDYMALPTMTLTGYSYFPTCLDVLGTKVLTGSKGFDGSGCHVYQWDIRQARAPLHTWAQHEQEIVGCHQMDEKAVALSKDGSIVVWNTASGVVEERAQVNLDGPCASLVPLNEPGEYFVTSFFGKVAKHKLECIGPYTQKQVCVSG